MMELTLSAFPFHTAALAICFFLVAVTGRNICNIGFIERPLSLGLIWTTVTGEMTPALPLAIFFELFWLDLFPIGSYLPPMTAFPLLLLLPLAQYFAWTTAGLLALPIALSLPLAYAPVLIEKWQRKQQIFDYMQVIRKAGRPAVLTDEGSIFSVLSRFIFITLGSHATLYILLLSVLVCTWQLLSLNEAVMLRISWPMLYIIAALGGVMALRIRRAYAIFSCVTALMAISNV